MISGFLTVTLQQASTTPYTWSTA